MNPDNLAHLSDRLKAESFDPTTPHTFTVVQELRCLNCGARYVSGGRSVHLPSCRGIWWDVDGEPRYYIDGKQVLKDEYLNRCPLIPEGL